MQNRGKTQMEYYLGRSLAKNEKNSRVLFTTSGTLDHNRDFSLMCPTVAIVVNKKWAGGP